MSAVSLPSIVLHFRIIKVLFSFHLNDLPLLEFGLWTLKIGLNLDLACKIDSVNHV